MEPLRIAIDGNEANCEQRVGSNVYAWHILNELEKITRQTPHISCTILLAKPKQSHLPERRTGWRYQVVGPKALWTQWALPIHLLLNKKRYDVFFTPGHYAPRFSAVPYVSTVMDTAYLLFPDQFKPTDTLKLRNWTDYSARNADKIIAISNFTKQEVIRFYDKKPSDIEVAYPSIDQPVHLTQDEAQKIVKKLGISHNYFLYVGTIQPRKNLIRLIEGYEIFCRGFLKDKSDSEGKIPRPPELVIAGKVGWLAEPVLNKIAESEFQRFIVTTGYIEDRTKAALYSQATASALVGLYEGFGIPPLESLAYGCIPIVSNGSSLPEAVGQAGLLVDPLDTQSIADALSEVTAMSKTVRAHWRRRGREHLQKFSWNMSAKIVLRTVHEVAQKYTKNRST